MKKMPAFERNLSLWVVLCMAAGTALGYLLPGFWETASGWTVAGINLPIAVLVWAMIFPMMARVDFSSILEVKRHRRGLALTLVINWLVKPLTMAALGWLFFKGIYSAWYGPEETDMWLAGAILLGAAPCTAMVFVWSYLADGNANFTLTQVSANDLVLLFAYIPIVELLLDATGVAVPWDTLALSVALFVALPLAAGYFANRFLTARKGAAWYENVWLAGLRPFALGALALTLVLLFAYQGKALVRQPLVIVLIAAPLVLQTYLIFFISWGLGRRLKLPFATCAPAAFIGASNFFELAVAVAIALFGVESGAALATVVGVLVEVPVMLSLVALARRFRYA